MHTECEDSWISLLALSIYVTILIRMIKAIEKYVTLPMLVSPSQVAALELPSHNIPNIPFLPIDKCFRQSFQSPREINQWEMYWTVSITRITY